MDRSRKREEGEGDRGTGNRETFRETGRQGGGGGSDE